MYKSKYLSINVLARYYSWEVKLRAFVRLYPGGVRHHTQNFPGQNKGTSFLAKTKADMAKSITLQRPIFALSKRKAMKPA
jgi:hypothetical protein